MQQTFQAKDRQAWRGWLQANHQKEQEIILVYYKKATGKPSITYRESVEEAICFGWIDGIKRRIDEERYSHRFTVRRAKSKWSPLNIRIAKKLIEQGKMTLAGLKAFEHRLTYDQVTTQERPASYELSPQVEQLFQKHPKAWENYNKLAPSYQKRYAGWIMSAKKEETLQKRLKESIHSLENDEKLGMK
jgi:uncharacterized protein YdeI (YjbR/CyaY-like superfamily)